MVKAKRQKKKSERDNAMEAEMSSTQSCSLLFGGNTVSYMIDISVRQPLCFFKSIHIIVDGHKIKMSILFCNIGLCFYYTLLKSDRFSM